ncbi:hypothetical protein [Bacillus sp. EB600]|nr:hypothetical protein [Bacillus sp. EB600]MCQ6280822.1 hypothetical protein [Bacillus sp. EB600]
MIESVNVMLSEVFPTYTLYLPSKVFQESAFESQIDSVWLLAAGSLEPC